MLVGNISEGYCAALVIVDAIVMRRRKSGLWWRVNRIMIKSSCGNNSSDTGYG